VKLLFLDIDGVLNSEAYSRTVQWLKQTGRGSFYSGFGGALWDFCPRASALYSGMIKRIPDVNVVISSSWRVGRDLTQLRTLFKERGLPYENIIAQTGVSRENRGLEIQDWLDGTSIEPTPMVILDDDTDMAHLSPYLVQTSFREGLTCAIADEVVRRFEGQK
jgi:hypothetical protein